MSGIQINIPEWYAEAPCAEVGGDLWFPEAKAEFGMVRLSAKPAIAMCERCPFKAPCSEEAIVNHINHGIWGATTPRQRVDIRRERGIAEREEMILDIDELVPVGPLELEVFDVDD